MDDPYANEQLRDALRSSPIGGRIVMSTGEVFILEGSEAMGIRRFKGKI